MNDHLKPDDHENDFRQAGEEKPISLVQEFLIFIKEEKKWWMIPILLVLAVLGIAAALTSTGAAPFIYTLF